MIQGEGRLDDAVATSVRAGRARLRLTQHELAERLGWPRSTLAILEQSRRRVTLEDLPALCRVFEISLKELLRHAASEDIAALNL